jgi:hypothetical protein
MSDHEPTVDLTGAPRVATWLVQKLCIVDQLESIEGDLLELYERRSRRLGLTEARRAFWCDALGACLRHSRLVPWLGRTSRKLLVHGTAVFIFIHVLFPMCEPVFKRLATLLDPHPVLKELADILLPVTFTYLFALLYCIIARLLERMLERFSRVSRRGWRR